VLASVGYLLCHWQQTKEDCAFESWEDQGGSGWQGRKGPTIQKAKEDQVECNLQFFVLVFPLNQWMDSQTFKGKVVHWQRPSEVQHAPSNCRWFPVAFCENCSHTLFNVRWTGLVHLEPHRPWCVLRLDVVYVSLTHVLAWTNPENLSATRWKTKSAVLGTVVCKQLATIQLIECSYRAWFLVL